MADTSFASHCPIARAHWTGASRIGAVGGDIVAIHILERMEGNAVTSS